MKLIPKFKFFAKAADGEMRMISAESMDLKNGFFYYSYHDYTVEGDYGVYGDTIDFENCVAMLQATGWFDRNGKEVYESDIVKIHSGKHSGKLLLVEFNHGICEPVCYYTSDSFEVVGNIYENPELLERVG